MTGIILMALGIILIIGGFVIYRSSDNQPKTNAKTTEPNKDINEEKQIGDDFEAFVVENFDRKYYSILDWTGDKKAKGQFVESSKNPDLTLQLKLNDKKYPFAVECKYRKNYFKGEIEISYPDQLNRYKRFEQEKNMPVFMVIGVGGTAKSPESLFVVPIKELNKTTLSKKELSPYYKNPDSKFFYVTRSKELE